MEFFKDLGRRLLRRSLPAGRRPAVSRRRVHLAVEMLEDRSVPAAVIEAVDPHPLLVTPRGQVIGTSSLANVDLLAGAAQLRTGVVADGNTRLVLRMESDRPVTFTLADVPPGDLSNGSLQALGGTVQGTSVTVNPVQDSLGRWWVFALYRSPGNFTVDSTAEVNRPIEIVADSSAGSASHTLSLERPPVVLVHGLWGNSFIAWVATGFADTLRSAGFRVYFGDYGRYRANGFDPRQPLKDNKPVLGLHRGVQRALASLRAQGIAVTQVDVVGHSMGGLVARAYEDYGVYRHRFNYHRGSIHKLITIGTPHRGTRIARVLLAHQNDIAYGFGPFSLTLAEAFALYGFPITKGGVRDVTPCSGAIRAIGRTHNPAFTITSRAGDDTLTEREMNLLFRRAAGTTIDQILGENNDTLVSEASGLGGLPSAHRLVLQNLVHVDLWPLDTGQQESPEMQAAVIDLLRAPLSRFASGLPNLCR
jgi:pimeloyl-ACP methyl ester carboxylesterase